jgi:Uma2 family endonuclease
MVTEAKQLTVQAFDELVLQAEYADRDWEYIGKEMVEVSSNNMASILAGNVLFLIKQHLQQSGKEGFVTGADGGYKIAGQRYIPDVAYTSKDRQPEPSTEGYNSIVPDLAVEVISNPANQQEMDQLRIKTSGYLAEGVLLWIVHPVNMTVEVYQQGKAANVVGLDSTVSADPALPELQIAVRDIFEGVLPE